MSVRFTWGPASVNDCLWWNENCKGWHQTWLYLLFLRRQKTQQMSSTKGGVQQKGQDWNFAFTVHTTKAEPSSLKICTQRRVRKFICTVYKYIYSKVSWKLTLKQNKKKTRPARIYLQWLLQIHPSQWSLLSCQTNPNHTGTEWITSFSSIFVKISGQLCKGVGGREEIPRWALSWLNQS